MEKIFFFSSQKERVQLNWQSFRFLIIYLIQNKIFLRSSVGIISFFALINNNSAENIILRNRSNLLM